VPNFSPARDQDAWATIRGFKFQVDQSILRWLSLRPHEHLELECGEDIDLVAHALTLAGDTEYFRQLEQVKVHARRLTLRSAVALESLANAYAQRVANPSINLRFRFTTNAELGQERPNPFPSKMRGIELWEQLRIGKYAIEHRDVAIQNLRSLFQSATRPKSVSRASWTSFLDFMQQADDEAIVDFVERFEWSYGTRDPDDMASHVRHQLRQLKHSFDNIHTDELYHRLFLFTLQLLTTAGEKRLTNELLLEQLAMPTLSGHDHQLLQRVTGRLTALELRVEQVADTVTALSAEVHSLIRSHGGKFGAIDQVGLITISAPPAVAQIAPRNATVAELVRQLSSCDWLALYGASDTGKTQLSTLIASSQPVSNWLRFHHEMPSVQATAVILESLRLISGQPSMAASPDAYAAFCRDLKEESFLLLDDLPRHESGDALTEHLSWLAIGCRNARVKLVSTSRYRLPTRTATIVGPEGILEVQSPQFSDSDARELFLAYGASDSVLPDHTLRLINALASGHPLLLTLAARYLAAANWKITDAELDGLLRGDHARGIADEVLTKICNSLDPEQRDLLYRLCLSIKPIKDEVALQLANVHPSISHPKERLSSLIGAWLQRPDSSSVSVSPVAKGIAHGNLDEATFRNCHLALAHSITSEVMDPWDAQFAIGHFTQAHAFNNAGMLLLSLLSELRAQPYFQPYSSIMTIWAKSPLPAEMEIGIRIFIRALQFWVYPRYGQSDAFALKELDQLIGEATPREAPVVQRVAAVAQLFLSPRDFPRAIKYFNRSVTLLRESKIDPADLMMPRGKKPVESLWNSITNIQTVDHLEQWLDAFNRLDATERQVVMRSKDAILGCMVLADRLILIEADKPDSKRNWSPVASSVQRIHQLASEWNWEHLEACAIQSEITLFGDYLHDTSSCEQKVNDFMQRIDRSEEAKSLVAGMYGKMFASHNQRDAALPWLERAISRPPIVKGHNRLMTFAAAVKCTSDLSRRRELAEQGAELARKSRSISRLEAVKALGELAIATVAGEETADASLRAYPVWSEVAEKLLIGCERNGDWQDLFVVFGHIHSFLVQLANGNKVPEYSSDGSPYAPPFQGMWYTNHPDRVSLYEPESVPGIMWFQSIYARAAKDEEAAILWLQRAKEEVEELPETYLTAMIRQDFVPGLLNADDFAGAVDAGHRGLQASMGLKEAYLKQGDQHQAIPYDTPVVDLASQISDDGRKQLDQFCTTQIFIPALIRIARIAVTDRPFAIENARLMVKLCKAEITASVPSDSWSGAARIFETIADESSLQDFQTIAESFDPSAQQGLRLMAYVAFSVLDSPQDAYATQLASVQLLHTFYPPELPIHRQLVLPFFEDYWVDAFRRQRFAFRSPALIEAALGAAIRSPINARTRSIMRAIQPGFIVRGLPDAERWLHADAVSNDRNSSVEQPKS
jgi:hypothetical protein